jgi:hypothetical protein
MTDTPLPPIGEPLRTGDAIEITCEGRTVPGVVKMASPNGRSLFITFEAWIAGHVGQMPVLQQDDGSYIAIVNGAYVSIKRRGDA